MINRSTRASSTADTTAIDIGFNVKVGWLRGE